MYQKPYAVLVTIDKGYIRPLQIMLRSLLHVHPEKDFSLYILHSSLEKADLEEIAAALDEARCRLFPIRVEDDMLDQAPVTDRYPKEMYYRIFAARYLPEELDRVLYLDPDLVVINPLDTLYEMDLEDYFFAAASHVHGPMQKLNELRLDMEEPAPYINTGVMMLHLSALRREQDFDEVTAYIRRYKNRLLLPDQDVISGLYAPRILPIDPFRYNMTERLFLLRPAVRRWLNLDWVRRHTAIVHYCGRNKPWKKNYIGKLDVFWREAEML